MPTRRKKKTPEETETPEESKAPERSEPEESEPEENAAPEEPEEAGPRVVSLGRELAIHPLPVEYGAELVQLARETEADLLILPRPAFKGDGRTGVHELGVGHWALGIGNFTCLRCPQRKPQPRVVVSVHGRCRSRRLAGRGVRCWLAGGRTCRGSARACPRGL